MRFFHALLSHLAYLCGITNHEYLHHPMTIKYSSASHYHVVSISSIFVEMSRISGLGSGGLTCER